MTQLADLRVELEEGIVVARLSGEVDASNARELGGRLAAALPNAAMGMVLDLTGTGYLDSAGVHFLFELAERLRQRQQQLYVVIADESFVSDIAQAVALSAVARVETSVAASVAALRAAS